MRHIHLKTTAAAVIAAALAPGAVMAAPIGIDVETNATFAAFSLDPAIGTTQTGGQVVPGDPQLIFFSPTAFVELAPGSDVQASVLFGTDPNEGDYMNATTLQTWENGNDLSYEAFFSSSRDANYEYATQTLHYFTVTNNNGAQRFLTYDFELTDMFAEFRYAYADDTENPLDNRDLEGAAGVRLWMELATISGDVLFEAESVMWAYSLNNAATYSFDNTNINTASVTPLIENNQIYGYNIDLADVVQSIDLGLFAPGTSQQFVSTFQMEVIQGTFEIGIEAGAVDPGNVSDRISLTGDSTPSPIPLPATAWSFLAALLALGAMRRSRAA